MNERVSAKQDDSRNWLEHRIGEHLGKLSGQLAVEFGYLYCKV